MGPSKATMNLSRPPDTAGQGLMDARKAARCDNLQALKESLFQWTHKETLKSTRLIDVVTPEEGSHGMFDEKLIEMDLSKATIAISKGMNALTLRIEMGQILVLHQIVLGVVLQVFISAKNREVGARRSFHSAAWHTNGDRVNWDLVSALARKNSIL